MTDSWLIRYGEIALKGQNRNYFENLLIRNIKDCLKKNKIRYRTITKVRGRMIVFSEENCEVLKNVFGITSISPATQTELDRIGETSLKYYKGGSFRITTQRITKETKEGSQEINKKIGKYVVEKTGAKVKLKGADVDIGIELIKEKAYVFNKRIKAVGGLPLGCEGTAAVILENEDSLKAAYLMMKRGCKIILVEKKKINYDQLKKYSYGMEIKTAKKIPEDAKVVVTSENIGNIKKRRYKQVVIRPLI